MTTRETPPTVGDNATMLVLDGTVRTRPQRGEPPRRAGLIVLVLVLAVLLAATAQGPGTPGRPAAAPLPAPPPIGSCLVVVDAGITVTGCDEPHNAEIMTTWQAGDLPADAPPFAAIADSPFGSRSAGIRTTGCRQAERAYLQHDRTDPSGSWRPVRPLLLSQLIAAPAGERSATDGWIACVVGSSRTMFSGSVKGGFSAAHRWDGSFASCLAGRGDVGSAGWTTCATQHRIEVLASFDPGSVVDGAGAFVGPPDDAGLARSCAALVSSLTGSADPTYGGRLEVHAEQLMPGWISEVVATTSTGERTVTYVPVPICFVELVGDGILEGSVIGLGDSPLPVV